MAMYSMGHHWGDATNDSTLKEAHFWSQQSNFQRWQGGMRRRWRWGENLDWEEDGIGAAVDILYSYAGPLELMPTKEMVQVQIDPVW